jgi:glycosyltransferase involved in cell wall biosynthesis
MKIAVVAQHATPARPRSSSSPRPDDAVLQELTNALSRQGHRVTVYTAYARGTEVPGKADLADGLRFEYLPIAATSQADVLAQVPAFSEPLRKRLLRNRPDVVHAVSWTSGLAALSATRGLGIPVVQAFSSLGVGENRDHRPAGNGAQAPSPEPARMRLRLEPAIGRSASAVMAASSEVVSDLTRMGVPRTSVRCVPWGVDTDTFTPEGPAASRNGRPRLLTSADLTERAALETLLRALTKVPDAELMVVGGPARDRLHADTAYRGLAAMTGNLGLSDRVMFTGRVSRRELPALMRSADLVLSTCAYEPSGVTSLEAMACGKPVMAPPTGGHIDAVVDGTTGIIIPPGRPALLAQRIRQLLAHPLLMEAYGVAAVDRARSRYSWDRIATETLAVYDRAVEAAA